MYRPIIFFLSKNWLFFSLIIIFYKHFLINIFFTCICPQILSVLINFYLQPPKIPFPVQGVSHKICYRSFVAAFLASEPHKCCTSFPTLWANTSNPSPPSEYFTWVFFLFYFFLFCLRHGICQDSSSGT